jgi:regulatory protein
VSPSPLSCYEQAVRLLAARPHFRAQLAAKLARRGHSPEAIEAALDRLVAEGYIDDRKAALDLAAARRERGGEGARRLRAELARRGAPPEAVAEVIAGLPEDDRPAARAAAERWAARGGSDPRSLARHLERKGFSRRAIVAVLNERPGDDDIVDLDESGEEEEEP